MAHSIAKRLRASQQQNIKCQQAPDGTLFAPRRTQPVREKKGRVKHEMFKKLRTAKYMKAKASADDAAVEFTGNVQRMARVHHYAQRYRPAHRGKEVQYKAHPLLGVSESDQKVIEDVMLSNLKG